MIGVPP
jgi:hypothetical protein